MLKVLEKDDLLQSQKISWSFSNNDCMFIFSFMNKWNTDSGYSS